MSEFLKAFPSPEIIYNVPAQLHCLSSCSPSAYITMFCPPNTIWCPNVKIEIFNSVSSDSEFSWRVSVKLGKFQHLLLILPGRHGGYQSKIISYDI